MWTRKAVVYVGLGTILVLFSPFINNLQLFLLGTTILGFVAVHSLVNTRPIDVKITRSFESDQVFENSDVTIEKGLADSIQIQVSLRVDSYHNYPRSTIIRFSIMMGVTNLYQRVQRSPLSIKHIRNTSMSTNMGTSRSTNTNINLED